MSFFRTLQQLLPDGAAWRTTTSKMLRSLLEGLAAAPQAVRDFIDDVYDDLFPTTTRELDAWEEQFGITYPSSDDATRRTALAGAWQATGGQSPRYLQDIVQAAGFDLYVHEWWSSGPSPYVARDPRSYTSQPLIGTVQCGEPLAQCGEGAYCNAFLANDPGYIVNLDLTPRPPPPVPDDATKWPYFLYFCDATFGDPATLPNERRAELEELLLRICPTQHWIVLIATWVAGSEGRVTLQGDRRVTLQGDHRVTLDLL